MDGDRNCHVHGDCHRYAILDAILAPHHVTDVDANGDAQPDRNGYANGDSYRNAHNDRNRHPNADGDDAVPCHQNPDTAPDRDQYQCAFPNPGADPYAHPNAAIADPPSDPYACPTDRDPGCANDYSYHASGDTRHAYPR
jgi:hypothetical protein